MAFAVVFADFAMTQIHPKYLVPVNAIYVTALFSFLLSLIYIGSETAFYAITSLFTVALLQCYMFSIGSILWRRIKLPETIPESSFSLGRWGIPINAVAFVWCAWSFVSLCCRQLMDSATAD
jgi:choline transport protein